MQSPGRADGHGVRGPEFALTFVQGIPETPRIINVFLEVELVRQMHVCRSMTPRALSTFEEKPSLHERPRKGVRGHACSHRALPSQLVRQVVKYWPCPSQGMPCVCLDFTGEWIGRMKW